jgi:hypothetical protein
MTRRGFLNGKKADRRHPDGAKKAGDDARAGRCRRGAGFTARRPYCRLRRNSRGLTPVTRRNTVAKLLDAL